VKSELRWLGSPSEKAKKEGNKISPTCHKPGRDLINRRSAYKFINQIGSHSIRLYIDFASVVENVLPLNRFLGVGDF